MQVCLCRLVSVRLRLQNDEGMERLPLRLRHIVISRWMHRKKLQTGLGKWKEVRRVACKREDRFRHNTIAFWLSDEEKNQVEAKIVLSGISKGEYYRKAVLGQEVTVIAGNYMSVRVAKVLEQILIHLQNDNTEEEGLLLELVKQLLEVNKNAPAGNKGIYE